MSALLDKVNLPDSLLAAVAAAPTEPVYLASRSVSPITSTPVGAIVTATTPGCIQPCQDDNAEEDMEDDGDVMSS